MIRLVPLLLRPSILSIKNNWLKQSLLNKHIWRDILVILCVTYLLFGLYKLSDRGFSILYKYDHLTRDFLPAVFNSISVAIVLLIFFSSCSFSLSILYLAEDLELILASPISRARFYLNKFIQILIGSGWIILLGSVPCILALKRTYGIESEFLIEIALLGLPLLVLPVASAIIGTTLITRYLAGRHLRLILPLLTVTLLLLLFGKSQSFFVNVQKKEIDNIIGLLESLNELQDAYPYFSWLGEAISDSIAGRHHVHYPKMALLYAITALTAAFGYLALIFMHGTSLTRVRNSGNPAAGAGKRSRHLSRALSLYGGSPLRAIIVKEFKIFARDFSHLIQMSIVLIICVFYLYNFQAIFNARSTLTASLLMWQFATFLCNIAFGFLIITSLCTRFVFSSLSMEGNAFWVLSSSPLTLADILRAKFRTWYLPVAVFTLTILVSGCFALQSEPYLIVLTVVCGIVMSYSLTALAVCLGAAFVNFNWVHNSQIFASAGSVVFIFSALVLALFNLALLTVILFVKYVQLESGLSNDIYLALTIGAAIIFVLGNFFLSHQLLALGERSLRRRIL